jgi:hypothetical protein
LQQLDHSIIDELEDAVQNGTPEKRVETLRQVTNLFLHEGERLNQDQIKVFDDVLCLLIARVETRARGELSKRLALIDYAPFETIQRLARDNEIEVAGSVLSHSSLRTSDLVEIASTRGQDHLFAISGRNNLPEAVTDVIVDRGERKVIRKLANNASARFSDAGYSTIVARADADDELTEILGLRIDLPIELLRDLLRRATNAVRVRLAAIAPPELQEAIKQILTTIASAAGKIRPGTDFSRAAIDQLLNEHNELDDAIIKFVAAGKFEEVAASLRQQPDGNARGCWRPRPTSILFRKSAGYETIRASARSAADIEEILKLAWRDGKLSRETARPARQVHNRIEKLVQITQEVFVAERGTHIFIARISSAPRRKAARCVRGTWLSSSVDQRPSDPRIVVEFGADFLDRKLRELGAGGLNEVWLTCFPASSRGRTCFRMPARTRFISALVSAVNRCAGR